MSFALDLFFIKSNAGVSKRIPLHDESRWDCVRKGICCLCHECNIDTLLYRYVFGGYMSKAFPILVHRENCDAVCKMLLKMAMASLLIFADVGICVPVQSVQKN